MDSQYPSDAGDGRAEEAVRMQILGALNFAMALADEVGLDLCAARISEAIGLLDES